MPEIAALPGLRASRPEAIGEVADRRRRPRSPLGPSGRALIVAADHAARVALGGGRRADAMADRRELLDRLSLALSRPGVTGVLGTPDVVEDLLLLGTLDDKAVLPVADDMERVAAATSLPTLLLGGEVADDQDATYASWQRALEGAPACT